MLDFDLFSIFVTTDERNGKDVELFKTFDEAKLARWKYGNWMCGKGDVYIRRFAAGRVSIAKETWHVCEDGHIDFHY